MGVLDFNQNFSPFFFKRDYFCLCGNDVAWCRTQKELYNSASLTFFIQRVAEECSIFSKHNYLYRYTATFSLPSGARQEVYFTSTRPCTPEGHWLIGEENGCVAWLLYGLYW